MQQKLYAFIIGVFLSLPMLAQTGNGSIKGKLLDEVTKEPIPFAAVIAEGTAWFQEVHSRILMEIITSNL